jgi:hypothetical protein
MKVEISHDTLAKTVFEKVSAEDRMRLRVANLIKAKFLFHQEKNTFLTADELKFIAPFESQLTLSDEESRFITRSKILARKQSIALVTVIFISVAILVWFMMGYRNANKKLIISNTTLEEKQDSLAIALDDIIAKNQDLMKKDSISRALRERIRDDQGIINMTTKELQEALNDLRVANLELEKNKKELEKERDILRLDKRDLTAKLRTKSADNEKIRSALSVVGRSQKLSQTAQEILNSEEKANDKEYKEAFRLARAAWEMSKGNSQAMDVLNRINNEKMNNTNGGFLNKTRPRYTYTYRKIEGIIRSIDSKHSYGKLSKSEINRLLR